MSKGLSFTNFHPAIATNDSFSSAVTNLEQSDGYALGRLLR